MIRLVLLAAIVAVAWYLYRRFVAIGRADTPSAPPATPPADAMSRCEECGVHVPASNGVRYQEHFFCTPEHLNDFIRKQGKP